MSLIIISNIGFCLEVFPHEIDFQGYWRDIQRSVPAKLPVSASVNEHILVIQSASTSVDITIVVSRDGVPVFEKTVPASQTSQVVVDMSRWEKGAYVLELRNKWGGYLYGFIN